MAGTRELTDAGVSEREAEVLALLREHLTNAEIAGRLFLSVRTVESHVSSLLRKLDVTDRRALAEIATREHAPAPRAAMPVPLTSFVGRAPECEALAGVLADHRLVTAVGPGGVGKTRLAIEVADQAGPRYADGARYVDLVPVTDPAMVGPAVATALGFGEQPGRSPTDTLISKLGAAETLLVLDNCEHLLDGVTELVERILRACPGVTMLATSRGRLRVPFEYVFPVPGLSVHDNGEGDATQLFVERAAMAGWSTHYPDDRRRIAVICQRLDGVALAIELAAARVSTLGLDGLEGGLADQLGMLSGGPRLDERHRSVRSALDWSFGLLAPDEQVVLRRTSVFAAPFSADAAATVAGFAPLTPDGVVHSLARLAEHNLLIAGSRGGVTRYQMLEVIRQYGAELMAGPEDDDVRARHLGWCTEVAASLEHGAPGDGFEAVGDDLRAALGWAAGRPALRRDAHGLAVRLAELTFARAMPSESQRRYEEAARLAPDPGATAAALRLAGAVAWGRSAGNEAAALFLSAAEAAQRAVDDHTTALNLLMAAEIISRAPGVMSSLAAVGTDRDLIGRAQQLAFDDPHVAAATVSTVGWRPVRDPASDVLTERAVELARRVGDARLESATLDNLTAIRHMQGDLAGATALVERRLELVSPLAAQVDMAWEFADTLHMAPMAYLVSGDLATARRYAEQRRALPLYRETEHLAVAWLLTVDAVAGDLAEAVVLADRFRHGWEEAGRPAGSGYGFAPAAASMVHGLRGDEAGQAGWGEVYLEMRRAVAERFGTDTCYKRMFDALVALHRGDVDEAVTVLSRTPQSFNDQWHDCAWRPWYAAAWAEAAVLARLPDRRDRLDSARFFTTGNPVAAWLVDRAEALDAGDQARVLATAPVLGEAGCRYQQARSLLLAGGEAGAQGEALLAAIGASPMSPAP